MKKKSFIEDSNPALRFITGQEPEGEGKPQTVAPAPEGYKLNPAYIETKSKRVQLLLKPSTYKKIKALAERAGTSFNDFINTKLEEIIKGE